MTGDSTQDLPPELEAPRSRFIAELGERIVVLRQSLGRFGGTAEPAGELNALRRRVHALAAGASVLRFQRAAEALASAENALAGAGGWDPGAPVRERVARVLDLLPSLVLDAPLDLATELDSSRLEPLREPLCVVVVGDATLEALLQKPGSNDGLESHATRQPDQAIELVTQFSPDVVVLDGDLPELSEILPRLRQASGLRPAVMVAVGSFDRHEPLARLIRRGVSRVLPKPTDAATLQRTLRQVTLSEQGSQFRSPNYRKLSSDELIELIGSDARRAFRDPNAAPAASLDFGSGAEAQAALWAAFARLRSLAARHGPGSTLPFASDGPWGASVLAPDAPVPSAASSKPPSAPVPLSGRRLVVADDDPAVRTLLSNAFTELGATVLPARDGAEALELAERHWPDALISDTLMPHLDGFELCRRLRQDIALSDLPVLLVAWKDHLLQCTRGASSGRALEQLDGPSLTRALRDSLAVRVALEQRLAQHDAVHGRLDGLTPRLLLQMVCSRAPNALLSLRSGRLTFEFSIADGKPVHARWYDGDRVRGEGKAVLCPFLGVRTGRFSVEPLFSPPLPHFEGDAMAVLNPAALRARSAREQLGPRQLAQVDRIVLDPLASEQYTAEVPTGASIVSQLGSPGGLQRLAAEETDGVEPGRLHAVLAELARRGAIGALLDRGGHDLLPGGPDFRPGSTPPGSGRSRSSRPAPAAAAPAEAPRGTTPARGVNLGAGVVGAVSEPRLAFAPPPGMALGGLHDVTPLSGNMEQILQAEQRAAQAFAAEAEPDPRREEFFPTGQHAEPAAAASDPAEVAPASESSTGAAEAAAAATTSDAEYLLARASLAAPEEPGVLSDAPATSSLDHASDDDPDSDWPPAPGARFRAALGRGLLSLGAALIAFLAIRALAFRNWDSRSATLHGTAAVTTPPLLEAPRPQAADASAAHAAAPVPAAPPLLVETELLDLPADAKLPAGQGLLEVRSWQPQQIYVDGVFMGKDENRLIPLGPGSYQLRLGDGAQDVERSVEVKAGRRTRLSARPKTTP